MNTTHHDSDVIIVGAGPVGLMLANILGMYGRSVTVLEALDDLIDYPRGVGLDDESFRTIQTVDLVDSVRPHTNPQHIMRLVNGAGKVILVNNPQTVEFGWERKHGFIQPEVDRALYEGLSRFDDVRVLFGHQVETVEEDTESVTAIAHVTGRDGTVEEHRFRARYLVGCEGGKSPTRKRLGVTFEGESPSTRWLVVDVNNDPLGTPNVFLGADPKRPYVSIGLPHAVRRWEFMLLDGETEEQVTDPAFVDQLLAEHVPDPSKLEFIRRRVFTHHGRVASSFRKGRQIVAGDAAHLMPVWMGQGWNSGMRDADQPRLEAGSGAVRTGRGRPPRHLHRRAQGARAGDGRPVAHVRQVHQDHQPGGRRPARRRVVRTEPLPPGEELLRGHALQAHAALHPRGARRSHDAGVRPGCGPPDQQTGPGPNRQQHRVPGRRAVSPATGDHPSSHRRSARRRDRQLVVGAGVGQQPARSVAAGIARQARRAGCPTGRDRSGDPARVGREVHGRRRRRPR